MLGSLLDLIEPTFLEPSSRPIHLVEIGGRTYIGQLSDATEFAPDSLPAMRQRPDPNSILSEIRYASMWDFLVISDVLIPSSPSYVEKLK